MKRKRDQRRCRGAAGKIPALIFCAAAVLYDLTVAANCDEIKDAEAFAEKVVQKYEENSFRTTKFSVDLGEDIDLVRFHVYLRREEIGEKEELFQIRYQDGDIILDGINGKR